MSRQNQTEDHILFYSDNISGDVIHLGQNETRHMKSVLRIKEGYEIYVTDGRGHIYRCQVDSLDRDSCVARIVDHDEIPSPPPHLDFYIGLPDKKPFEEIMETLVPLGACSITPVECEYCQSPWWERRWEKRYDRLIRKSIAAAKQSWNPNLPSLSEPIPFPQAMEKNHDILLHADPDGTTTHTMSEESLSTETRLSCFIGPPGGFSPVEKASLTEHGALPVWLSPFRLRTEHAATVMAAALMQACGDNNHTRDS
ncbi:MAG: RsmE family RNA methyltransferase [Planctomycetota bacterium]